MGFPGSSADKESACHARDPSLIPGLGRSLGEGIATHSSVLGLPWWLRWKETTCNVEDLGLIPGLGRSPGGEHGNPLQYSCLENPHGQRSLAGYSPWDHKELDMTEWLSTAQIRTYTEYTLFIRLQSQLSRALCWKSWLFPPPYSWHTANSPPAAV